MCICDRFGGRCCCRHDNRSPEPAKIRVLVVRRVGACFGQAIFPFLFRSPVSVADGLVSVQRAFRPHELEKAFVAADLRGVRIWRRFPYRLVAVAERGGNGGPKR